MAVAGALVFHKHVLLSTTNEYVHVTGLDDTIAHIVATTPELDDMEESMESSNSNNTSSK